MTQDRAAPGVYDPLETVSYFKYCITPHPLESQENAMGYININSMYLNLGYKNYVPHAPQIEVQFEVQIRVHREKSILKISQRNFRMKI